MAKGGSRPGAGRNPGGVSELTRILRTAAVDALAELGEENGAEGSKEELAVAAAKGILKDMAKAGKGDLVLKFFVEIAPRGPDQGAGRGGSVLLMAMQSAPGLLPDVTAAASIPGEVVGESSAARAGGAKAADSKSVARISTPFLGGQYRIEVDG